MSEEIRTERTFGVTAGLDPRQRRNLLNLRHSEIWPDLLDVLEMVCIEMETALINTDPADQPAVLANHRMAKAAWQMFTHMQNKVDSEIKLYLASIEHQPPVPELTAREQWAENILNPISTPPPDEDYTGI